MRGGANINYLSKMFPNSSWIGVDWADKFFEIGKKKIKNVNYKFIKGDFYKLDDIFDKESFDIVLSIQTLSWLPDYSEALVQLMKISKHLVFISGLFTDFNVDIINNVSLINEETWERKKPYNYNIYSIKRFQHFCEKHGFSVESYQDFSIDIDIPIPKVKTMSTYTIKDQNHKRLQFSGPLYLPWKFICLRKLYE